jgi:hypothetical protein
VASGTSLHFSAASANVFTVLHSGTGAATSTDSQATPQFEDTFTNSADSHSTFAPRG